MRGPRSRRRGKAVARAVAAAGLAAPALCCWQKGVKSAMKSEVKNLDTRVLFKASRNALKREFEREAERKSGPGP